MSHRRKEDWEKTEGEEMWKGRDRLRGLLIDSPHEMEPS
jgi:hypothetical protein